MDHECASVNYNERASTEAQQTHRSPTLGNGYKPPADTRTIGVAGIFRWWVRPGVDPPFLVGETMDGPERGVVAAKRRSAEGAGVWGEAP